MEGSVSSSSSSRSFPLPPPVALASANRHHPSEDRSRGEGSLDGGPGWRQVSSGTVLGWLWFRPGVRQNLGAGGALAEPHGEGMGSWCRGGNRLPFLSCRRQVWTPVGSSGDRQIYKLLCFISGALRHF